MAAPVCRDMDPLCVLSALGREDTRDRKDRKNMENRAMLGQKTVFKLLC